jgi:hypothetical protein
MCLYHATFPQLDKSDIALRGLFDSDVAVFGAVNADHTIREFACGDE